MTTTSVLVGHMPTDPAELVPYAELVRDTSACRLWQGQSTQLEPHQSFAWLAGAGYRVPVGTAVTLAVLRHPFEAAVQARSLATLTGNDVVLGIGTGATQLVEALRGEPYDRPLRVMRDYLGILRGLLDGDEVDHDGPEHRMHGALGGPDERPRVRLGLGVLRPAMARLAGEVADVAITWMTPPDYVRDVIAPALADGARRAGRPVPRLVTVVHVAVTRPWSVPQRTALTAARHHLGLPHYVDVLRRSGLAVHPAVPAFGARALVDSGTFVHGSPSEVARGLARYAESGVDEVVLNVEGVRATDGPDAALDDLREILG